MQTFVYPYKRKKKDDKDMLTSCVVAEEDAPRSKVIPEEVATSYNFLRLYIQCVSKILNRDDISQVVF